MTKRLLVSILALAIMLHTTGCTSGGSKDDSDVAESNDEEFSDEGEGDFADESEGEDSEDGEGEEKKAVAEGDDLEDDASMKTETAEASGDKDELSLDEGDESLPEEVAKTDATKAPEEGDPAGSPPQDPQQAQEAPPTDEPLFTAEPPKEEPPAAVAETPPAPSEPVAPAPQEAPQTEVAAASEGPAAERTFLPVVKIKTQPFTKAGTTLNRVYIARPGDTVKSVAKKIYGKNRSKDLKAWNPHLNRGMKTGDKVYYSSPSNPGDSTSMMTFYEDVGAPPQTYVTKDGDNIRKVAKELLGSSESWKEIWATNMNVDSKGDVPAGVELKYWPEGVTATIAQNDSPPPAPEQEMLPPKEMEAPAEAPPAFPNEVAAQPPPSPSPAGQMNSGDPAMAGQPPNGNMANNDPLAPPPDMPQPPPPDMQAPPPPPPAAAASVEPPAPPPPAAPAEPQPIAKKAPPLPEMESPDDQTSMMTMGAGGMLLIAAAFLYVVIRKNRAKRIDLSQTQV